MIRLEKEDLEDKNIKSLAEAGKMTVEEFRKRFSYLV
jgi:hypothetical protein